MILPPKRQISWSFSLKDDELSDSSQETEDVPQPRVVTRCSEIEELIAEAEQEAAAEDPKPELFDISLVEEGEVRFVETPFTIARRAAAIRKRARTDEEGDQDKLLSLAELRKAKKLKLEVPKKQSFTPLKTSQARLNADDKPSAASISRLTPPRPFIALQPRKGVKTLELDNTDDIVPPPISLTAAQQRREPSCASSSSPMTPRSAATISSKAAKTKRRNTAQADETAPLISTRALPARRVHGREEPNLGGEVMSSAAGSESGVCDPDSASSIDETLPSSPPPRSPSPSLSSGSVSTLSSDKRPRISSGTSYAPPDGLKAKSYPLALLSPPMSKSRASASNKISERPSHSATNLVHSFQRGQTYSVIPQTPFRPLKPACAPLVARPRPPQQSLSSAQGDTSTPRKVNFDKLTDLSPPSTSVSPYSRPIAGSSPSRARPTPTPPRTSASTTNAHWSTLSSRSHPSLIPIPSAYGSALNGISSTSAIATRFALPEFAPQRGGVAIRPSVGGTRSRMNFKPAESLSAFKVRTEKEKNEQQRGRGVQREVVAEEAQERILLGANIRSVKRGTVVSVEKSTSKEQSEKSSVYRDFDW